MEARGTADRPSRWIVCPAPRNRCTRDVFALLGDRVPGAGRSSFPAGGARQAGGPPHPWSTGVEVAGAPWQTHRPPRVAVIGDQNLEAVDLGPQPPGRRQPREEGVDQTLAAAHGVSLRHPADRLRSDPEPHLAAVRVELGPEPEGLLVGFPAGLARRQRPRAAGPVLAPPLDDDLRFRRRSWASRVAGSSWPCSAPRAPPSPRRRGRGRRPCRTGRRRTCAPSNSTAGAPSWSCPTICARGSSRAHR